MDTVSGMLQFLMLAVKPSWSICRVTGTGAEIVMMVAEMWHTVIQVRREQYV
jgi:hypothetical protein